jgi:hypothetical protein
VKTMRKFKDTHEDTRVPAPEGAYDAKFGETVRVTGEVGKRFEFQAFRVDNSGRVYADVIGGRKGEKLWRAFAPERIRKLRR